jgi:hypothetical protein
MRAGVDGYGPAIHLPCVASLLHVVPSTLQYAPITNGLTLNAMPSAGGSEYVWYGNGLVQSVDLFTFAASSAPVPSGGAPVLTGGGGSSNWVVDGAWAGHSGVVTVPSSSLRKAYLITGTDANNPQNKIIRYATDPLTSPQGAVVLPFSAQDIWTIVD